ncbi:MAG TPA: copper resistance protein B [Rudaea sp.]|jgi:copper resistance protein B|nr:copper resistance protein B [Rudaea sp.]
MRVAVCVAAMLSAGSAFADESDMSKQAMNDVMQMDDDANFGMLKFDQLEHALAPGNGVAWEADAWYGGDFDKIWLRSEGEHSLGQLDARTELFWDHAFAAFWDWQLGERHDAGLGAKRDWAAFGLHGTAPYGFEIEATAYASDQERTAFRFRAETDLLITQRLVVQPELETNFYGKSDPLRDVGSGLSDAQIGLRLRYEIRREFAPYAGVVWTRRFGDAARFARDDGHDPHDTQLVIGVRFWF